MLAGGKVEDVPVRLQAKVEHVGVVGQDHLLTKCEWDLATGIEGELVNLLVFLSATSTGSALMEDASRLPT